MNAILKTLFALVVVGSLAASAFAGPAGGGGDSWNGSGGYPGVAGGWHYGGSGAGYFSSPGGFHNYASGYYSAPTYSTAPAYSAAAPQVESRRAYSYEPAPALKAGDAGVIAERATNLKIGDHVVATVPQGTRVSMLEVRGAWVGVALEQNGRKVSGWVLARAVARGAPSAAPAANAQTDTGESDQKLIQEQKTCPVSGKSLGSMGQPVKVVTKGRTVFLCCNGCKQKFLADVDSYLKKLDGEK